MHVGTVLLQALLALICMHALDVGKLALNWLCSGA